MHIQCTLVGVHISPRPNKNTDKGTRRNATEWMPFLRCIRWQTDLSRRAMALPNRVNPFSNICSKDMSIIYTFAHITQDRTNREYTTTFTYTPTTCDGLNDFNYKYTYCICDGAASGHVKPFILAPAGGGMGVTKSYIRSYVVATVCLHAVII